MDRKEYLSQWIQDCAETIQNGECLQPIVEHIKKHFVDDLQKYIDEEQKKGFTDWPIWFASALNLLNMWQRIKEVDISKVDMTELRIARLQAKYDKNPNGYTPPPKIETE